ncbi:hypothetical protein Tco_1453146 [Tanacetum coccineum]
MNVGIRELKTDNDVEEFLRLGYEQKWYIDLYVEHFDYDVLGFINEEANGVISSGSSDEYYSSDECEEIEGVDFHTKMEENVVIKNLSIQDPFLNRLCTNNGLFMGCVNGSVPQTKGDALEDHGDDSIDPSCMRYEHPEQLKLALANYGVANGKYNNKNKKVRTELSSNSDVESSRPAKSAKTDASTSKSAKYAKIDASTSKSPKCDTP